MKTRRSLALLAATLMLLAGCTDAEWSKATSIGSKHRVTFYPPGNSPPEVYTSTGKVFNEKESDGFYFRDAASGKLMRISGAVKIEVVD